MLIKGLKILFSIICVLLPLLMVLQKLWVSKIKDNMKKSDYVAFLAIVLGLYIILGIILAFVIPDIKNKCIIAFFALSPFIIGKFATYKTEVLFSIIQMITIVISGIFVILYFL